MNLLPHRRVYSATDNRPPVWGDDEDDDEGAIPTGRLSPCTFLHWSQDCKPWVRREIMDPRNVSLMVPFSFFCAVCFGIVVNQVFV